MGNHVFDLDVWQCSGCKSHNLPRVQKCLACGKAKDGLKTANGINPCVDTGSTVKRSNQSITTRNSTKGKRRPVWETLTKTEKRFFDDHLSPLWESMEIATVIPQLRFPLSDGTTYSPDFTVLDFGCRITRIIEVKGGYSLRYGWAEQGIERFRRAREFFASEYRLENVMELWQWQKQWRRVE